MRSSKKSCSLDPVPTSLVVECMDELLPVITLIINLSLQSGHFPEVWKEAVVTPLLKKCGSDSSNFTRIYVLLVIYPIFPSSRRVLLRIRFNRTLLRTICIQCSSLHAGNFIVRKQLCWKFTMTSWQINMNKQHVTLLVLLDLSAAFDTIDPSILLTRLRSKLGLNGTAISWFCSYLSRRTQRISVQGALSNVFHLRYGVPKGSCLGHARSPFV